MKPLTQGLQDVITQHRPHLRKRPPLKYFPCSTGQCLSTDHCQHNICEATLSTDCPPWASAIGRLPRACTYYTTGPAQSSHRHVTSPGHPLSQLWSLRPPAFLSSQCLLHPLLCPMLGTSNPGPATLAKHTCIPSLLTAFHFETKSY
jgi:hypothetical protein